MTNGGVRIVTQWDALGSGPRRGGTVEIQRLGADMRGIGRAVSVHRGSAAITALAARDGQAAVVLAERGQSPRVRIALVDLPQGRNGTPRVRRTINAARDTRGRFAPSSAVIAPTPEGFTVIWQEQLLTDANADVRTYMGRLAPDGSWASAPRQVAIPWALAALAWNGRGYHLAIYFGGGWGGNGSPEQTRICLVTLSPDGTPEQHPWWASPAGPVDETQLVPVGGDQLALVWRGGPDGTVLRAQMTTSVLGWGQEPPAPADHGRLASGAAFTARGNAGRLEILHVP